MQPSSATADKHKDTHEDIHKDYHKDTHKEPQADTLTPYSHPAADVVPLGG
jgi:hypothetical protein